MKIILIDDSGARHEFNKFVDLHAYELYMQADARGIIIGQTNDYATSRIPFTDPHFCRDTTLIYLADDEAVRIFIRRCEMENRIYKGIEWPGIYRRDTLSGIWENIDSAIAYHKNKAKHLELVKEALLKS